MEEMRRMPRQKYIDPVSSSQLTSGQVQQVKSLVLREFQDVLQGKSAWPRNSNEALYIPQE